MTAIHTTDWQPMVILGGISKKKETDLELYRDSNFLDQFKPGLIINGERLFTTASRNYVLGNIAPIYILGPGGLYEPLIADEAKEAVVLENKSMEDDKKLWQRLEQITEIQKLHRGKRLYLGPNDLCPTRPDLKTFNEYVRANPETAAVVAAIDAKPHVDIGFRESLTDKAYLIQNEEGELDHFAFPGIWVFDADRVPLDLVASVARDTQKIRGEGTKSKRVMWEIGKDVLTYLHSRKDSNPYFAVGRVLSILFRYNPTSDINQPVEAGVLPPVTFGEFEDVMARILGQYGGDTFKVGKINAASIAMDVDTPYELEILAKYHRMTESSSFKNLYEQGALEAW